MKSGSYVAFAVKSDSSHGEQRWIDDGGASYLLTYSLWERNLTQKSYTSSGAQWCSGEEDSSLFLLGEFPREYWESSSVLIQNFWAKYQHKGLPSQGGPLVWSPGAHVTCAASPASLWNFDVEIRLLLILYLLAHSIDSTTELLEADSISAITVLFQLSAADNLRSVFTGF